MTTTTIRLISVALAAVAIFSVGGIYQVASRFHPGVYCLLSATGDSAGVEVGRVDPFEVRLDPHLPYPGAAPRVGDTLLEVGSTQTPTFMHFTRGLTSLNHARRLAESRGDQQAGDGALVLADDRWWVRVTYIPAATGSPKSTSLDATPPAGATTPRVAWLHFRPSGLAAVAASAVWCLLSLPIVGIGALVVWRRPGDPSAAVLFVLCLVTAVSVLGLFHWSILAGSPLLVYQVVLCGMLLPPLLLHFFVLFPRPLAPVRRWPRGSLLLVYALPVTWILVTFGCLLSLPWLYPAGSAQLSWVLLLLTRLIYGYVVIAAVLLAAAIAALGYGWLRSRRPAERTQAGWILSALALSALPAGYLVYTAMTDRARLAYAASTQWTVYWTSMLLALACAVGITRYKLMHVGRLASRGLMYVSITFVASVVFSLLVGVGTAVVGRYYFSLENAVAAGLTAMLVVATLSWTRDRLQKAIDVRFRREKYQLDTALDRLGRAVDQLVEPSDLAARMLQSACDAVGAHRGAVYLRDGDARFELAVQNGVLPLPNTIPAAAGLAAEICQQRLLVCRSTRGAQPTSAQRQLESLGGAVAFSLEQEGDSVGLVILGPKVSLAAYTDEDRNFLLALARTTTLALHSARGHRTIETLKEELHDKVETISRQKKQIRFLQGQLHEVVEHSDGDSTVDAARPKPAADQLEQLIRGSSPAVKRLLGEVAKVAGSPSSVLIRGESGTGKGLLAQAIHRNSHRAEGPFVAVHCAALSPGLLESELFGHVRGAFTGADRDKVGRFEQAEGGTIFLDEIGDISLEVQTKLLRVLQDKSFERVGEVKTRVADVRLVTATHQDLEAQIAAGQFREDLYYRLNVISLCCPPLRERRQDIFDLAAHFLRIYAHQAGKPVHRIDEGALHVLAEYAWPGNVRQLENAIERAVVLTEGEAIRQADLPPEICSAVGGGEFPQGTVDPSSDALGNAYDNAGRGGTRLAAEIDGLERTRLVSVLAQCNGNKSEAARILGMPRSTLFSKLRRLGL